MGCARGGRAARGVRVAWGRACRAGVSGGWNGARIRRAPTIANDVNVVGGMVLGIVMVLKCVVLWELAVLLERAVFWKCAVSRKRAKRISERG